MAPGTASVTATNRALDTSEILRLILEHISDVKSLAACARTCRVWHEVATPVLWRGSLPSADSQLPDAGDLDELAEHPDRFQHYLKYMKYVDLGVPRGKQDLKYLWNPQLWRGARYQALTVDLGTPNMTEDRMKMLLHENLLSIQLFGGSYSDGFLETLKERSPRLRWFLMDQNGEDITSKGMLRTLQDFPGLEGLELWYGFEFAMSEPVLIQLANLRELKHLSLGQQDKITRDVIEASNHKLQSLRSLELSSVEGAALQVLLPQLAELENFSILLREPNRGLDLQDHVLYPLSKCPKLLVLILSCQGPWNISPDAFRALSKGCSRLRVFELAHSDDEVVVEAPYDGLVGDFMANLRFLEEFEYNQPCTLNRADLEMISQSCPLLKSLSLRATLDLEALEQLPEHVHFPNVQTLEVGNIVASSVSRAHYNPVELLQLQGLIEGLLDKFPNLTDWQKWSENFEDTNAMISYAWVKRRRDERIDVPHPHFQAKLRWSLHEEILSRS